MMARMPTILQNHYVLAVPDARASARFYVDALGFRVVAEPDGWVFVSKDQCLIMLGSCPDDLPPGELGCHSYFGYLVVDDVDRCYAELAEKGVTPLGKLADEPWGMREFALRTPDGHRIKIGQVLSRRG